MRPWTLRDARRAVSRLRKHDIVLREKGYVDNVLVVNARGYSSVAGTHYCTACTIYTDASELFGLSLDPGCNDWISLEKALSSLDAAISQFGASAIIADLPKRESPKGTDEVGNLSSDPSEDSPMHGGDGNSGECDAQAETSADARESGSEHDSGTESHASAPRGEPAENDSDGASEANCETGEESSEDAPGSTNPAGVDDEEHEPPKGEATSEGSDPSSSERGDEESRAPQGSAGVSSADADDPRSDSSDVASASAPAAGRNNEAMARDVEERHDPTSPAETESEPEAVNEQGSSQSDAGLCDSEQSSGSDTPAPTQPRLTPGGHSARPAARDVKRALNKLLDSIEPGGIEETPRTDGRRLARELISRRYSLSRSRRREADRSVVVFAVDSSGSCNACCSELWACAIALAAIDDRILVIEHSNGFLYDSQRHLPEEITCLAKGRRVAAVIALGDWDAGDEYQELCESGSMLFWLDSYCAKDGPKPASKNLKAGARTWKRQPTGWWQGVSTATATAIALRAMRSSR